MLRIGLTGGIGSGKSIVAKLFSEKGIEIIDADEIGHALVEPGEIGLQKIVDHFGGRILTAQGRLDRATLRKLVFDSPVQKKALEAILHPLIYHEMETQAQQCTSPYNIACVPLLVETGANSRFDRILVIDTTTDLQVQRVKSRDNLEVAEIRQIISSQVSRETRLGVADDVIVNDRDIASLDNQVEKLHNFYLQLSKNTGLVN